MESTTNSNTSSTPSKGISRIEEIGIVLAANDLNPTMAGYDFLKVSGIVPQDWELSRQPIQNPSSVQLSYTNGVNIAAQPRTVSFSETLTNKSFEEMVISKVATRYINKLPNANYFGMSCTPKIIIPFSESPAKASQFISERLLGSGSWKNIGKAPVQASINLMYYLERCQLSISIAEAKLEQQEKPPIAAILFSGSFSYNIPQEMPPAGKLNQLKQALNFWQQDLSEFREIVAEKFMEIPEASSTIGEGSLFPSL